MTNYLLNFSLVLFEQAREQNKISSYVSSAKILLNVLESDAGLNQIISNRFFSKDERRKIVDKTFDSLKIKNLKYFVYTVIDMEYSSYLVKILNGFLKIVDKFYNKPAIQIISAFPLTSAQTKLIVKSVEKRLNKKVVHTVSVNKDLIGGIKVVGQDFIYDNTISTKLESMKGAVA